MDTMKGKKPWVATACLMLCCAQAWAAVPDAVSPNSPVPQPSLDLSIQPPESPFAPSAGPEEKSQPIATPSPSPSPEKPPEDFTPTNDSDHSALDHSEAFAGFNPQMIGDFLGGYSLQTIVVPSVQTITTVQTTTQTTTIFVPTQVPNQDGGTQTVLVPKTITTNTNTPVTIQVPIKVVETIRVPIAASTGAFKITENESPVPQDRVFLTYNYFSNVTGPASASSFARSDTQVTNLNGSPATVSTLFPAVAAPQVDVHRETFGFEKTFLDKNASLELRLPVFEEGGSFVHQNIGDVSLIFKYAVLNDRAAGNVLSTGLVASAPTGPDIETFVGNIHSFLLQPFVGYVWNQRPFYVLGFNSLVVPTDSRDVTLLFNDVALGYLLYHGGKEQFLRSVTSTVEAHITTPLNHRGSTDPIVVPDLVVLTAGVHFGLGGRSTLTLGAATPVTGPRVYDIEAMAQFNWRF
jgi:hypothetical protein